MVRKSCKHEMLKLAPHSSPRKGRHFLRAAVVPKTTVQVGEPVRVQAQARLRAENKEIGIKVE